MEYRFAVARLDRRCREAASWNDMAEYSGSSLVKSTASSRQDVGAIKSTAMTIEEEACDLALKVSQLRNRLLLCISQMHSPLGRDVIEALYISGLTREQLAQQRGRSLRTINRWLFDAVQDLSKNSDFFPS